jgi:spore maturation protein CgeB
MSKARRIFVIADFKEITPKSIRPPRRHWVKGLIRLGHDVQRFSYADIFAQCAPWPNKRLAKKSTKEKVDKILIDYIKNYQPDIIFCLLMKDFDEATMLKMKEVARHAVFVGRDVDPTPEVLPDRLAVARHLDILISTGGGAFLKTYKKLGVPLSAFLPNPCDPDIHYRYEVTPDWHTDIMFAGKPGHGKHEDETDRVLLFDKLAQMKNARIYGGGFPQANGVDYFRAISGAKITLSINVVNDVSKYHSDRFTNSVACGTFTLAKRVPDTELLYEDGKHVKYFDTVDAFFALAEQYLNDEPAREKIALQGMQHLHEEFNCVKIANYFMQLVESGSCDARWAEIV